MIKIKFEKGFTPEKIATALEDFFNDKVIDFTTVTVYINDYKEKY